jgi:hypothetical protein
MSTKDVAAIVEGLGISGPHGQRPFVTGERFVEALQFSKAGAAVVEDFRIIGA